MKLPGRGQPDDKKERPDASRPSRGTGREQPDSSERGWLSDRRPAGAGGDRPGARGGSQNDDDFGFGRDRTTGQRRPGQSPADDKSKDEGSSGRFGSFMRRGESEKKPAADEPRARPTGQFGSSPRRGEESKPGAGRPGSSGRPGGKDDEKSGGLMGRFGRGKKDDEKKDNDPRRGSPGGGTPPARRTPFLPGADDDDRDDPPGGTGLRPTGGLARPGSFTGRDRPGSTEDQDRSQARPGGYGTRDRDNQPGGARPGGYEPRDRDNQPGGARPGSFGARDRDDQPGGARPGGFGTRDREDAPGGFSARPGGFETRDRENQPGGARPGSFDARDRSNPPAGTSPRFGTSPTERDTSDRDRPGFTPRSASQSSSFPERRSPYGTEADRDRGKKDDKSPEDPKSGGILGRFGSRGKEEKKDDKRPDTSARSTFSGGQSATRTTGTSPTTGSTPRPGLGTTPSPAPRRGNEPAAPASTRGSQTMRPPAREDDRSRRGAPPKKADKTPPPPKTRSASKARSAPLPESKQKGALTAHQGLDFERKIDLIGVALVGFALVAFFAVIPSMSFSVMPEPETGLTGSLNHLLSQLFGWGKIVWPLFAFGVGVWLMVHSFAESGFELNYFRVFGVISLYACALALIQMFELINETAPTVEAFKPISHDLAIEQGRGGGWLGHQIYTFLLSQFLDLGTMSVLFAWLVISLMATFDLSVVELWGYVAGLFLFLRPNPEARARRRAAREARTAEIVSAMRPGEATRQMPLAPPAAAALPTQTQEAPAVETERRRFGLGRRGTAEGTPVPASPSALPTASPTAAPAAEAPTLAEPTEDARQPSRPGPMINRRGAESAPAAPLSVESPDQAAASPAGERADQETRQPERRPMPHLRTQEIKAGESKPGTDEGTEDKAGRGRLGMFRRGRGESDADAPAEKDAATPTMSATDRRDTGALPGIPVPPRRTASETPTSSTEEKTDEGQPGRFGRFMRRPGRDAGETTPAESAAADSEPLSQPRTSEPADTDSAREKSIRERMSPFGRRAPVDAAAESTGPEQAEKPASVNEVKPATEEAAPSSWLTRRPEDRTAGSARPFERADRTPSPLSEPPPDTTSDTTAPDKGTDAPRTRPFERADHARSPLTEAPERDADGADTAPPARDTSTLRPSPFERPDRLRTPLGDAPARDEAGTGAVPLDRDAEAPRPRSFERPDRLRTSLSESPEKPEDAAPPAPEAAEARSSAPSIEEKAAEPIEPLARPARPDLLQARPFERPRPDPASRSPIGGAPQMPPAERATPDSPEENTAPVQEPPARPRGLVDNLRRSPLDRPIPEEAAGESKPPGPVEPPAAARADQTARAESPPSEAPPAAEIPVKGEDDAARAVPPAVAEDKTKLEPAALRRALPGALGTPRPTADTPHPPVEPPAGPAAPRTTETLPQRPSPAPPPRTESPAPAPQTSSVKPPFGRPGREPAAAIGSGANAPESRSATPQKGKFQPPDFTSLLRQGEEQRINDEILLDKARVIEDTLMSFGAPGKVVEVNPGPVITQFGIEPSYLESRGGKRTRVKVGSIARLDADLALALAARSIRIEAPVPGKGFVGIEVPNDEVALVGLLDIMQSPEFKRIDSKLRIALGLAVDGSPVAADLATMPHLLIAGTTGSGKSVCVNAIISCLLLQNTPEDVQLIMVDPKRVELTGYNGIPHLVAPVVVDLERIVGVLQWVQREMEERYRKFAAVSARNILDYNNKLEPGTAKMPYYVVIVDELADLMMLAPDETERLLARLAQMARATGIHLIISTQRPSVDIITGLIKANFPARIAFAVASSVDSRVILDQPGAEKLLGRGDMLYQSPDAAAPLRMQGVYVSDDEITAITRYWRGTLSDQPNAAARDLPVPGQVNRRPDVTFNRTPPPPVEQEDMTTRRAARSDQPTLWEAEPGDGDDDDMTGEDELYDQSVELVQRLGKASISLLQRRLRIGYTRAARLIDRMEADGIVGPSTEGSKPREVLILKSEDAGDD